MPDATVPRFGVSYLGNRYPDHARRDLRAIAASGASFVVHAVSESDLRWNPETIGELAAIGREEGLQPWFVPWALGGVFGGESASYAVGEHPAACQRAGDGRHLPALCPRQPVFRTLITDWLDAAVATGAEVVQWDELHLALPYQRGAADWACRCGACQEAFRERYDEAMPETVTATVAAFTRALLAETLAWLVAEARARGLQSSIVQLADESYDPAFWRAAAALPGVRYFGSTPFWYFYDVPASEVDRFVTLWSERIVAATDGTAAIPLSWVQAFQVPVGRETEIPRAVMLMRERGVEAIAVWAYLACAAMSRLAADDVAATWDAVTDAFAIADSSRS